jgi:heterodisulfide reductase subunit A
MARMGVFVCWCGANIAENVDCDEVARYAGKLPSVVIARSYKYMCSDPGQKIVTDAIEEHKLTGGWQTFASTVPGCTTTAMRPPKKPKT